MKIKRILAAVFAVTVILSMSMTVSAKKVFDDATDMKPLELYDVKISERDGHKYYKITLTESGRITMRCRATSGVSVYSMAFKLLDSNAEEVGEKAGETTYIVKNKSYTFDNLERGDYYIDFYGEYEDRYATDFYYTFVRG